MPYIKEERKDDLVISSQDSANNAGELNYLLTMVCLQYWLDHGRYQAINDIVGALECCKLEFYERVARKYEDYKKHENGDVYADAFSKEQVPSEEVQPNLFSNPVQ